MREQLIVVKEQTRRENIAFFNIPNMWKEFYFWLSRGGGGGTTGMYVVLRGRISETTTHHSREPQYTIIPY